MLYYGSDVDRKRIEKLTNYSGISTNNKKYKHINSNTNICFPFIFREHILQ